MVIASGSDEALLVQLVDELAIAGYSVDVRRVEGGWEIEIPDDQAEGARRVVDQVRRPETLVEDRLSASSGASERGAGWRSARKWIVAGIGLVLLVSWGQWCDRVREQPLLEVQTPPGCEATTLRVDADHVAYLASAQGVLGGAPQDLLQTPVRERLVDGRFRYSYVRVTKRDESRVVDFYILPRPTVWLVRRPSTAITCVGETSEVDVLEPLIAAQARRLAEYRP